MFIIFNCRELIINLKVFFERIACFARNPTSSIPRAATLVFNRVLRNELPGGRAI